MQEWLHMAGGHNKVEYCSGSHLKERGFRSTDLSLALALSLRRGLIGAGVTSRDEEAIKLLTLGSLSELV